MSERRVAPIQVPAPAPAIRPGGLRRLAFWLEPRWSDPGWWAFALNRFTGIVLVAYLIIHFFLLSQLANGPAGWDSMLGTLGSKPFLVGDTLLIAAVAYHGLNGIRVSLLTFGIGTQHSGAMFGVVFVAAAVVTVAAGLVILK